MECAAVREFTGIHNMIRGLIRLMEAGVSKAEPGNAKQTTVLRSFGLFAVAGTHFHHRLPKTTTTGRRSRRTVRIEPSSNHS